MREPNSPGKPALLLGAALAAALATLAQAGPVACAESGPVPPAAGSDLTAAPAVSAESTPGEAPPAGNLIEPVPLLQIPAERTGVKIEPPPAPPEDRAEYGDASWYGPGFHGRIAASGETYDASARTVAHPTLPMGTVVRIENMENGHVSLARVNDRGPFADGRIVDCSWAVAAELGFLGSGVAPVRITVLDSIVPAAQFQGAAQVAARLPWRRPAKAAPAVATAAEPVTVAAAATPPVPRDLAAMRQASVLPFPAIVHASYRVYDWLAAHRSWFRVPEGVRTRLAGISLRTLVRLYSR